MEYGKEVGKKIRKLRQGRDLTLRAAAEEIGMDYSHLSKIEKGQIANTKTYEKIADYFGVDITYLLGERKDIPSEMEGKIQKWFSVIETAEKINYSPEDLLKIMKTIESIKGNQD